MVYAAVRVVITFLQWMPLWIGYKLAKAIAWIAYHVDKRHRKVALDNLQIAFPEMTDAERDKTVRGVYRHFITMIIEIYN